MHFIIHFMIKLMISLDKVVNIVLGTAPEIPYFVLQNIDKFMKITQ